MLARPSVAFAVGHNGGGKVVIGKQQLDERSGYTGSVSGYASMEQESGSREEEVWRKPSSGKQFRSAFAQELEMEEGAARGQQSEAIRGRDSMAMISRKEAAVPCVHGNADCAVCAVTDEQVEAVRRENLRLKAQIERVGSHLIPISISLVLVRLSECKGTRRSTQSWRRRWSS